MDFRSQVPQNILLCMNLAGSYQNPARTGSLLRGISPLPSLPESLCLKNHALYQSCSRLRFRNLLPSRSHPLPVLTGQLPMPDTLLHRLLAPDLLPKRKLAGSGPTQSSRQPEGRISIFLFFYSSINLPLFHLFTFL